MTVKTFHQHDDAAQVPAVQRQTQNLMRVAFNLDRVLSGKYAGRSFTFTDGDEIERTRTTTRRVAGTMVDQVFDSAGKSTLVPRDVQIDVTTIERDTLKKDGFTPVIVQGKIIGFARAEDGLPLPSATEFEAAVAEIPSLLMRNDPIEERLSALEVSAAAQRTAAVAAKP